MHKRLSEYLKDPGLLDELSVEELREWLNQAPYSQSLRRMLAEKLTIAGIDDPDSFADAAVYSSDRQKLYDVIKKAEKKSNKKLEEDELTVSDEKDVTDYSLHESTVPVQEEENMEEINRDVKSVPTAMDTDMTQEGANGSGEEESRLLISSESGESPDPLNGGPEKPEYLNIHEEKPVNTHERSIPEEDDINGQEDRPAEDGTYTLSEFSTWLLTLRPDLQKEKDILSGEEEDEDFSEKSWAVVSPTLAELLLRQGHPEKACEVYRELMLKYPEKSDYFAAQIEKINSQ